ncbi:response regulator [Roseicella aquatilis]|uniref:Response regulator n=1 Tax=Roseicella aquatilis TaxID=2527868 RepID=A0A4R4DF80_9PROT|nr:response regulator [Roseicella aquatilis]TCZ58742.1 response regulator [Roseicella aquatilis]
MQPWLHHSDRGTMDDQGNAPVALVVEDEALLALEMEALLAAEGFDARIACTEAAARKALPEALSVAVVNLRINGVLAGHGLIRDLRRRIPDLPVVVVTGYDSDAPQADLRGLGWPTVRLQKPQHVENLLGAVRNVMNQARNGTRPAGGRRRLDRLDPV